MNNNKDVISGIQDSPERMRIKDASEFMLYCGNTASGEKYFQSLARYLAGNLEMDFVCIARLQADGLTARTEVIYIDGRFDDNVIFTLKDTPFGDIEGKMPLSFPQDARSMYPDDALLRRINAESYLGAILRDSNGKQIGLIAAAGRKPFANVGIVESIFSMAALCVGGKLEQKLQQEALALASYEWESTFDSISDMVFLIDENRTVIRANAAAKKTLGVSCVGEGHKCHALIHGMDFVPEFCISCNVFDSGESTSIERQERHLDNQVFNILAFPVPDASGKTQRVVHVIRNISDAKRAESEREALQQQLLQAQKMDAIGTLAGGVAHDFNNMLAIIMGNAQLARMDMPLDSMLAESLTDIENAAGRAKDLTMKLLSFARKEKIHVHNVNVNIVLEEIVGLLKRSILKKIVIKPKLEDNLPVVNIDVNQMHQVFLNICNNACDAMPSGGTLTIASSQVVVDDAYAEQNIDVAPGKYCLIQIADTGIGMIDEVRTRIFEPFFTTKGAGKGTGLGLSVSYGVVKNHGGFINVYSELGEGSNFKIYLPCAKAGSEDTSEMFSSPVVQTGTETILVVDDEEAVLKLAGRILKKAGYTVLLANSGKKAVELHKKHRKDIALVVLDMIMPDMDGRDVYQAIKKMKPDVKVVLSSGYSINGKAGKLMAEGIQGFVQKPFSVAEFCNSVRNVIDGKTPS
ncbi:MAG: response regulator [Victivallales bacterium]